MSRSQKIQILHNYTKQYKICVPSIGILFNAAFVLEEMRQSLQFARCRIVFIRDGQEMKGNSAPVIFLAVTEKKIKRDVA